MSNGAELQVILPIVNAPFRLYYAYNPLRLFRDLPQQLALPQTGTSRARPASRASSPIPARASTPTCRRFSSTARQYTLREPRKTFRLTVSTTF